MRDCRVHFNFFLYNCWEFCCFAYSFVFAYAKSDLSSSLVFGSRRMRERVTRGKRLIHALSVSGYHSPARYRWSRRSSAGTTEDRDVTIRVGYGMDAAIKSAQHTDARRRTAPICIAAGVRARPASGSASGDFPLSFDRRRKTHEGVPRVSKSDRCEPGSEHA